MPNDGEEARDGEQGVGSGPWSPPPPGEDKGEGRSAVKREIGFQPVLRPMTELRVDRAACPELAMRVAWKKMDRGGREGTQRKAHEDQSRHTFRPLLTSAILCVLCG